MRIIEIWTLKDGPLTPHRPLDPEHNLFVEKLWQLQDNPVKMEQGSRWRERCDNADYAYLLDDSSREHGVVLPREF